MKIEFDETIDPAVVGVLTPDELERDVFVYGETTDQELRPGERLAVLAANGHRSTLLYGCIPTVKAAATAIEYAGGDPDPDLETVAEAHVEPFTWVVFTRHRLECTAGGNPTVCGCAPADNPDGYYVFGANEDAPGAVPVTPVILPAELGDGDGGNEDIADADRPSDALQRC